eukprot:SAG31_NODE_49056_length_156_cov_10.631579_1_plen_27_part_10
MELANRVLAQRGTRYSRVRGTGQPHHA